MIPAIRIGSALAAGRAPATPGGGARQKWQVRGCSIALALMVSHGAAASAEPERVEVPSGQTIILTEVLLDPTPGEIWARFRFHAPQIGRNAGNIGYDVSAVDMDHLCDRFALPYLTQQGVTAARIVISLANEVIEFGSADPTVTQFFEAYRPESARCIWEEF